MSVNTPFHTLLEVFLFTEQSETNLHHSYAERYLLRFTHALSNLSLENDHKQTTAPSDRHRQTQTIWHRPDSSSRQSRPGRRKACTKS